MGDLWHRQMELGVETIAGIKRTLLVTGSSLRLRRGGDSGLGVPQGGETQICGVLPGGSHPSYRGTRSWEGHRARALRRITGLQRVLQRLDELIPGETSRRRRGGLISNKIFIDILLDLITLNLGTNSLPDVWMHLTVSDLQNLATTLTVNSELIDWRRFLLTAAQPWPVPSVIELLNTLHSFKAVDEAGSGFVTQEYYNQVDLCFKGSEDLKMPENPTDPLPFNRQEHLIMFFFILFADARKDPSQLDYTKMLLYFASHPDAVEGVYRALSIATGTYIHRRKEVSPPHVSLSHTDMLIKEEPLVEKEKILYCTDEGRISMATLQRVFHHEGSKAGDNHRFSGQQKTGSWLVKVGWLS
ncbi:sperm flagellar protein 2-like [Macrochelys suwanniensis]